MPSARVPSLVTTGDLRAPEAAREVPAPRCFSSKPVPSDSAADDGAAGAGERRGDRLRRASDVAHDHRPVAQQHELLGLGVYVADAERGRQLGNWPISQSRWSMTTGWPSARIGDRRTRRSSRVSLGGVRRLGAAVPQRDRPPRPSGTDARTGDSVTCGSGEGHLELRPRFRPCRQ